MNASNINKALTPTNWINFYWNGKDRKTMESLVWAILSQGVNVTVWKYDSKQRVYKSKYSLDAAVLKSQGFEIGASLLPSA